MHQPGNITASHCHNTTQLQSPPPSHTPSSWCHTRSSVLHVWTRSPASINSPTLTLMPCWLNFWDGWNKPPAANALPMTNSRLPMMLPNSVSCTTRSSLQQTNKQRAAQSCNTIVRVQPHALHHTCCCPAVFRFDNRTALIHMCCCCRGARAVTGTSVLHSCSKQILPPSSFHTLDPAAQKHHSSSMKPHVASWLCVQAAAL